MTTYHDNSQMNVLHVPRLLIYYDYYFEEKRTTKKAMT